MSLNLKVLVESWDFFTLGKRIELDIVYKRGHRPKNHTPTPTSSTFKRRNPKVADDQSRIVDLSQKRPKKWFRRFQTVFQRFGGSRHTTIKGGFHLVKICLIKGLGFSFIVQFERVQFHKFQYFSIKIKRWQRKEWSLGKKFFVCYHTLVTHDTFTVEVSCFVISPEKPNRIKKGGL